MDTERNKLRIEILKTFERTSPPDINDLTVDQSNDSAALSACLGGVQWWLVDNQALANNFDNLPFLTPHAFHYYLPAFLLSSLRYFEPDNLLLQHTVYSLAPFKSSSADPRFRARRELFTASEVGIIVSFLNCILADERMYALYDDAKRGLTKFWSH